VTPEQTIPDGPMDVPWESCMTMGTSFSFNYEDEYKPVRRLIHLLLEVVAKGGNLALNVGPQPDGRLPRGAIQRMKELGAWLKVYGEGVYGTRMCAPYYTGDCAFTRSSDTVYCFYLYQSEDTPVREWITVPYTGKVSRVELLGTTEELAFSRTDEELTIRLTAVEAQAPIAHVFRITAS
jgi:alpha-L-fucosidase